MSNKTICTKTFILIFLAVFVLACGTSYQAVNPNPSTGYFSDRKPKKGEVLVNRPLTGVKDYTLIYLRGEGCIGPCYDFTKNMFLKLGVFKNVVGTNQLEQLIIKGGLSNTVPNITDLVGLNRLATQIGKFLVVDASMCQVTGVDGFFQFEIKIMNPTDGELYFHAYRAAIPLAGIDQTLLYPVFNQIVDWLKESSNLSSDTGNDKGAKGF